MKENYLGQRGSKKAGNDKGLFSGSGNLWRFAPWWWYDLPEPQFLLL
jgi:hypothetical protein